MFYPNPMPPNADFPVAKTNEYYEFNLMNLATLLYQYIAMLHKNVRIHSYLNQGELGILMFNLDARR